MSSTPAERALGLKAQQTPEELRAAKVRTRLPPTHESPNIDKELATKIKDATVACVQVEDRLNGIRAKLLGADTHTVLLDYANLDEHKNPLPLSSPKITLKWGNRLEVARSMSWQLSMRISFFALRTAWLHAVRKVNDMITNFQYSNISTTNEYNGIDRRSRRRRIQIRHCEPSLKNTVSPDAFVTKMPHADAFAAVQHINKYWLKLVDQATQDYAQACELLVMPEYSVIKTKLPKGGRAVYSALMVCRNGSLSDNVPTSQALFGWFVGASDGYSNDHYNNVIPNHRRLIRQMYPALPEKKDKVQDGRRMLPPSWERGVKELTAFVHDKTEDEFAKALSKKDRLNNLLIKVNDTNQAYSYPPVPEGQTRLVTSALLCGDNDRGRPNYSAHLLYTVKYPHLSKHHYEKRGIANNIVYKVMKTPEDGLLRNDTPTMLTGPVEHAIGSDYYAPCIYTQSSTGDWVEGKRVVTKEGWLLMRQGWPDVFHLEGRHEAGPPAAAAITEVLDRASNSHFARLKDAEERKLSMNTRIARLLKKLRLLPQLTVADSYAVSNCEAGTRSFIDNLTRESGHKVADGISGRMLARCWKAGKYIQVDRFANVVQSLFTKLKAIEKQRIMDGNPETAVHTEYAKEFMDRHAGEDAALVISRLNTLNELAAVSDAAFGSTSFSNNPGMVPVVSPTIAAAIAGNAQPMTAAEALEQMDNAETFPPPGFRGFETRSDEQIAADDAMDASLRMQMSNT